MGFLVTLFTKSMQDEENVLFFFSKSAFGKKICQGINWRSVLLNDEVSWRHSCPNSVISSGTGKHEIVSQAGVNFSSCSDFMLSLGLSTLQISPVRGMYLVLAELLLLDSGCKNSLITFLSFLGNEVCRLENYYCCYMWNLLSIWNHSSWIPTSMWKAHIWQSAPNRAKWHHPASAAFSYVRIATLVVRKTFSLRISLPDNLWSPLKQNWYHIMKAVTVSYRLFQLLLAITWFLSCLPFFGCFCKSLPTSTTLYQSKCLFSLFFISWQKS